MKEEGLINNISEIICKKLQRTSDLTDKKNWDKPLTGEPFYLTDVELLYLLFELEKESGRTIDSKNFDNYGFSTINNIIKVMSSSN